MTRLTTICCALALLSPVSYGQLPQEAASKGVPAETVGKGEFPGLQFLPPGSVLDGISLPRYENHRVTSLFTAKQMEVRTPSLVIFRKLRIYVYAADGDTTELATGEAEADFALQRLTAPGKVTVSSPRFEAEGEGFVFDQESDVGVVKGPVRTAIRTTPAEPAAPKKK